MQSCDAYDVKAVRTRADRSAFIGFPHVLHRHEPMWVPPLRGDQRRLMDRGSHPFYEFGEARFFLARRDGRVVGRIAAVHNPNHNRFHDSKDGFFGLFDCVDDPDAAEALFTAAASWLRTRGLETLLGPVSLSTNYECGVLTEGFDLRPAVQMPYNPSYYPQLMSDCGFTTAMELLAWELPATVHENQRLLRLLRSGRDWGVRIRPLDLRNFAAESDLVKEVYNAAWERNWGFSPMTDREFGALAQQLRPLLRPGLGMVAEVHGEPAGVALALPDFAPALAAANGRLHTWGIPLGLVRLLRARRRLDRVRAMVLGVREEYRGRGIELLLGMEVSRAAQRLGYPVIEASWTLADNYRANRTMKLIGARVTKKYGICQRPLDHLVPSTTAS
ncbi:GNAT family N-acetyltransferase [Streptomyces sp. NPDC058001]|uniref:GNAT family N-acetyltransferase n=1 Tax=Streptomyces sp. NPDC058001 TaxID=3346300 RepID=UPI0036E16F16